MSLVTPLFAHGVGGRTDLPVPTWMVGYGAAAVLIVSFAALAVFWREPRLERLAPGLVVARRRSVASKATVVAFRAVGLALFVLVLVAALFGVNDAGDNLAPTFIYVTFWVGLTILSAFVGDVYALFDPYETITTDAGERSYRAGVWPAAFALLVFVWLELVYDRGSEPRVLGVAMLVLTAAVVAGAFRSGRVFARQVNPFRVWFGMLAEMAPIGPDERGDVRWRWPLTGLAHLRPVNSLLAVVMVALGSTAFDGLTRSTWWSNTTGDLDGVASAAAGSAGLLAAIAVVTGLYLGAMKVTEQLTDKKRGGWTSLATAFVHSLVPIAFAYAVAHYVSLLLLEGQAVFALLSDPLGRGWDLFGTAANRIDYTLVSPRLVSWVQVASIVAGHVAGVVLAHDRALALFPGKQATRSQYPLLVVMVLFTVGGLALLLGG